MRSLSGTAEMPVCGAILLPVAAGPVAGVASGRAGCTRTPGQCFDWVLARVTAILYQDRMDAESAAPPPVCKAAPARRLWLVHWRVGAGSSEDRCPRAMAPE